MTSLPTDVCRYRYDALDLLTGSETAGQASLQRFYRHQYLVTELQGQFSHSVFQQGEQLLAVKLREERSLKSQLLVTDQQRSVLQWMDSIRPLPQVYTPYGHHSAESGLSSLVGFNGERRDSLTGHYLLGNGHRAFNPVLMRFNSPDRLSPFGRGGLNPYAYCLGDPVNLSDPTGKFAAIARILTSLGTLFNSVITLRPGIPFQVGLDALANGAVFRSPLRHTLGAVSAVSAGVTGVLGAAASLMSTTIAAFNPTSTMLTPLANTSLGLVGSSVAGRLGSWWAARDATVLPSLRNLSGGSPAVASRVVAAASRRPSHVVIDMNSMPLQPSSGFSPSAPPQTPAPSAPPLTPGVVQSISSRSIKRPRNDREVLKARRRIRGS
jgi:RHS repeat-associated protein